jgi:CrcB protein
MVSTLHLPDRRGNSAGPRNPSDSLKRAAEGLRQVRSHLGVAAATLSEVVMDFAKKSGHWLLQLRRNKMLLLMVGGAFGTAARYWVGKWFNTQSWAQGFPYGTFFINVTGSFILAVAAVVILERLRPEHQDWYLLIGTGFCGGYTTFSTFEWETFKLIRDGSWWFAFANVFGSVVAGFLGVLLGVMIVNWIFPQQVR